MKHHALGARRAAVLAVLALGLLTACGGGSDSASQPPGPTTTILSVSTMQGILGG